MAQVYAQGDVVLEEVEDVAVSVTPPMGVDSDGAVVLARGELSGHRHIFLDGGVTFFRDDALSQGMPSELYIGHIKITAPTAELRHDEHDSITIPAGCYRVRRQREWDAWRTRHVMD